ncbi:hypothetical protein K502DRAFT_347549 [Neoconidiobolus thromboides FSU 785]|nr:hypothetical protein K502DRAFT_347549 [Neoconidiobolus thromboides FSU 785]
MMDNKHITKKRVYGPKKEINKYNDNVIKSIVEYLPTSDRIRLMDLSQAFSWQIFVSFLEDLTDDWLRGDMDELDNNLTTFGNIVKTITINTCQSTEFYVYVFSKCMNATMVVLDECNVNEILDAVYSTYGPTLEHLDIGSPFDDEPPEDLAQIPNFPNLDTLKIQRMCINASYLNELLYFVPDALVVLHLSRLTTVDASLMRSLLSKFTNLMDLELLGDFFVESAVMCLDTPLPKLESLSIGNIGSLSRAAHKLKLKASNIPSLNEFKLFGVEGLSDDGNRMPHLLNHMNYPMESITMCFMNMDVEYTFNSQKFPNLRQLYLENCDGFNIDLITHCFTRLPNLDKLVINQCNLNDEYFVNLSKRPKKARTSCNLKMFTFRNGDEKIGIEFIYFLRLHLTSVEHLDVTNTMAEDDLDLEHIARRLKEISSTKMSLKTFRFGNSFVDEELIECFLELSPDIVEVETEDIDHADIISKHRDAYNKAITIYSDMDNDLEL